MSRRTITVTCLLLSHLLVLSAASGFSTDVKATVLRLHHDLAIVLTPDQSMLEARDRIAIQRFASGPVTLLIAPHEQIRTLQVYGSIPYRVRRRSQVRFISLVPHMPGIFDPDTLTAADADFVIMP